MAEGEPELTMKYYFRLKIQPFWTDSIIVSSHSSGNRNCMTIPSNQVIVDHAITFLVHDDDDS